MTKSREDRHARILGDVGKEIDRLRAALATINSIRNSIVGLQSINWSEHIYPLVAALDAAGYVGMDYPEARKNFGTLVERTVKAEERVGKLIEALRPFAEAWEHPERKAEIAYVNAARVLREETDGTG